jgi:hypothetical protein
MSVMDEDEGDFQEDGEDNIHCMGEETGKSYLTQHDYEESLMIEQINESFVDDGLFQMEEKNNTISDLSPLLPNRMHQLLPRRSQPLLSKRIRHQRINNQILQK